MRSEDFQAAVLRNPVNDALLDDLFDLGLPDAWIVSGCLVQTVWNLRTGRPVDYGINDYDVFYFAMTLYQPSKGLTDDDPVTLCD